MNYVITGSLGNISKPLVKTLLANGHQVTVISSNQDRTADIVALGAKAAIGSVEDISFLTTTFSGADAVYTMIPPNWAATNWKQHIAGVGKNYAAAIQASGVKKLVNLSSMGAHMAEGCGPVSGLFYAEAALNAIAGIDVLHLRPAYFYYNLFSNIGLIKHAGIIGGNFGVATNFAMTDPSDIAAVAADALQSLSFSGSSVQYIVSDEKTTDEIAAILGASIGKPDLKWVDFRDEDAKQGMLQAGLSEEMASNYVEMGTAIRSGEMEADYRKQNNTAKGKILLADFSKIFAHAFSNA
ncbi:MAG: NAD(P)H-binding protein [Bacteroidia bacterium]